MINTDEFALKGRHNLLNAMAAITVSDLLKIDNDIITNIDIQNEMIDKIKKKFGVESKINMLSETVTTTYGLGLYLSVISLPFVFLANRSINKDEKLVRDVDRLR